MNLTDDFIKYIITGIGITIGSAIGQIVLKKMEKSSELLKQVRKKIKR